MDIESICGTSGEDSFTRLESGNISEVLAKLRRLKIQEGIITSSLEKNNSEEEHITVNSNHNMDWKKYCDKLRNNINEIKNTFEDIKIATSDSDDNLKNINIEEVKKEILNLNSKIKSLEDFIKTELTLFKTEEEEILKQISEEPKLKNTKRKVKIQNKQYNEVVPSPVRVLINYPLKCSEVQQFQAFMSKSKNRYGGWNEYNHNIFIQIWNKYYVKDDIVSLENNMKEICCHKLLPEFIDEVFEKIPGIQLNEILLHSKWFSEYSYLKRAQQIALDKWKDNKRKIKGRQEKQVKTSKNVAQKSSNEKICRKENGIYQYKQTTLKVNLVTEPASEGSLQMNEEFFDVGHMVPNTSVKASHEHSKLKSTTFTMPTEQWINRCNDYTSHEGPEFFNTNIENVHKLCIPNWRIGLHRLEIKKIQ